MAQLVAPKISHEFYKELFGNLPMVSLDIFIGWKENTEITLEKS